jgi:hypothetical protein
MVHLQDANHGTSRKLLKHLQSLVATNSKAKESRRKRQSDVELSKGKRSLKLMEAKRLNQQSSNSDAKALMTVTTMRNVF